jgi:uncharacterized protein (DUF488 family)
MENNKRIYTIGHSTADFDTFIENLHSFNVQILIDVRSLPGSRHVPHFNKENLEIELPKRNIEYLHFPKLGGRRKSYVKDDYSLVDGWENKSFRNYASYTQTLEYAGGISELIEIAKVKLACLMCAESVPWKCHRSIISNTLTNLGIKVFHIMDKEKAELHHLNKYGAHTLEKNGKLIYPKSEN